MNQSTTDTLPAAQADIDCTSVGFSGEGRCIERAVTSVTMADGQHRVCFDHFIAPTFTPAVLL